jgi:hypothetical protein
VHLERAASLTSPPDEVRDLWRIVGRLRWRLGAERAALFALRGLMLSAVALSIISILQWLGAPMHTAWAAVPLVAALAWATLRWPSPRDAALAADARLGLAERLATAIQIARGPWRAGRFDGLQIQDAVATAHAARRGWLAVNRHSANRELLMALLLVLVALSSRLLLDLPRPALPGLQPAPSAADVQTTQVDRPVPDQALDASSAPAASPLDSQAKPPDPNLANRVQQAQAERQALDRLSDALGQVSAGQTAATDIQQGDYSGARSELSNLGDQADQLTDAAKQKLARGLQSAASATTSDPQLADRERQAAQALSKGTYADQRQALQQLGQQLERSGARGESADQLARDVGQLQQQGAAGSSGPSGLSASSGGSGQPAGAAAAQGGQGSGGAGDGQQGGPGVGTGSGGDPLGDANPRLDTAGQRVEVPTKLSQGLAVRPPDGSEDQASAQPGNGPRSVSEAAQPQQTGQVAPEQNLVPGDQRSVVRGYFH